MNNKSKNKKATIFYAFYKKIPIAMRMTLLFLFMLVFQLQAGHSYSQNTKISLNLKNNSIEKILQTIEEKSEFYFLYNSKLIDVDRKMDIHADEEAIVSVLNRLFSAESVEYEVKGTQIILHPKEMGRITSALVNVTQQQQKKQITGKITDERGEPIIGANVVEKGTLNGTVSDIDGNFSFNTDRDATLQISYIGYLDQEISTVGKTAFDIILREDTRALEEVVVVGYGNQKKETLTGAIAAVQGDELEISTSPNLTNALSGRFPGLVVISRTGEPGADGSTLRIRGGNTLGDNSPLVVVDGIANRNMDHLNPADIESISVLKDASAAIYGAQAANGVILVTTKRGEIGKPKVKLTVNHSWNSPTVLPDMADAATYATLINEIKSYRNLNPQYTEEDIQKYKDGSNPWTHPNTDWFDEVFKKNSPQYYANLSLSGGAERVNYFISVGTKYQDGLYKNSATNFSQADFRGNLNADITDNIKMSVGLSGRKLNRNYSGVGAGGGEGELNIFWATNRAYPYLPARWPSGEPGPDVEYGSNPVVTTTDATGYDRSRDYNLESSMTLEIKIPWVKGLSLTGNASFDKTIINRKRFRTPWELYSWDGELFDDNNQPVVKPLKKGYPEPRLHQWLNDNDRTSVNGLINYNKIFKNIHDVKILFGSEYISGEAMDFWAYRRFFLSETLDQMFAGGDAQKDNGGAGSESARLNYFGRINYAFDSKYLVEMVWRYDGSYIFPESKRYGFFPGISLGYRISEENFWKQKISFIDDLKIRGSVGQTGNDRIAPYQYLASYGFNGTYIFNQDVVEKTLGSLRTPNPNITWELANQLNIGFDAQFLNNKLLVNADYFYNLRTNILWWRNASVPASTGLSLPQENIGEVVNKGFDFNVAYHNNDGALKYQVSVNGTFAKNHIKYWDETPGIPDYQKSTGRPMNSQLYYQAIGVFEDQDAVDSYPSWPGARPGDIIFEDVNEDGKIDGLDIVRSEKTDMPTFTGGVNINLQYKNFYTTILFQGAAGAERAIVSFSGEAGNFFENEIKDRWTDDNPSSTHPRAWNRAEEYWVTDGQPNNTYWVRNTDYLRLKNLEIGYNLPKEYSQKIGIQNLRVYASGQNLFTFTGLKDYDPESPNEASGSIWVNNQVYPLNKTKTLGLTLTF